jgi:general secretion pathway protein G
MEASRPGRRLTDGDAVTAAPERTRMSQSRRRGFTLIELMVVIVILGALVALVGPNVWNALFRSERDTVEFQLRGFQEAIGHYQLQNRRLPAALQDLANADPKTGEPYMAKVPNDPWDTEYQYRIINESRREFEISSAGRDRAFGGEDDIVLNSKEGIR